MFGLCGAFCFHFSWKFSLFFRNNELDLREVNTFANNEAIIKERVVITSRFRLKEEQNKE